MPPNRQLGVTAPGGRRAGLLGFAPASGDLLLQLLHHVRVAQRGDVTELPALRDVAQQPAHYLARAGLGQIVAPDDPLRPGELADLLGDVLPQLRDRVVVALAVPAEGHERDDRL